MDYSRKKNATKNAVTGVASKAIIVAFPFIIRSCIIQKLGAEFLGLDSLFASILQVLNLAELGFSSAVNFGLYKPLAENNVELVCAYLTFFKKIYKWIGTIIFFGGICLTPFIPYLIKSGCPETTNIYVLYVLQLINTAVSYWLWAYKNVLLEATQKQSVLNIINFVISLIRYILQILVIVVFKNYYIYLVVLVCSTVANNIWVHIATKQLYPQYMKYSVLDVANKKELTKQVSGVAISRVATTCRNSFDSVFLSLYLGLISVTIYSNYYYIFTTVFAFVNVLLNAIAAGLGDYVARENSETNYTLFKKLNFVVGWLGTWIAICLLCLYQDVMTIWVGDRYLAPTSTMLLFCVYYYINHIGVFRSVYSRAYGIWWRTKHISALEMVMNIMLNATLGYFFGMNGILLATIITVFIFSFVWNGKIVMNECFKKSSIEYFKETLWNAIKTAIVGLSTYILCNMLIQGVSLINITLKIIICMIFPNILFGLISCVSLSDRGYFMYLLDTCRELTKEIIGGVRGDNK